MLSSRLSRRILITWFFALPGIATFGNGQQSSAPAVQVAQPDHSTPYFLKPGDDLQIDFFYNPELNQHAIIRPDGQISMPLLGEVHAAGTTVSTLTKQLELAYKDQVKRSNINIQVRSFANQIYFVGGEVSRPGTLPMRGPNVTALQAIVEAGGLKDTAAKGSVFIFRRTDQGRIENYRISLKGDKARMPESATFELQPLDVVIVAESGISKLDRVIDQYVKKLSPVLLTGGFTYLFNSNVPIVP
jgi:polysaccharide biosynthesis/export protein